MIFLPPPPKFWDCRHGLPHLIRLTSNSLCNWDWPRQPGLLLCLLSAEITGMCQYTKLRYYFFKSSPYFCKFLLFWSLISVMLLRLCHCCNYPWHVSFLLSLGYPRFRAFKCQNLADVFALFGKLMFLKPTHPVIISELLTDPLQVDFVFFLVSRILTALRMLVECVLVVFFRKLRLKGIFLLYDFQKWQLLPLLIPNCIIWREMTFFGCFMFFFIELGLCK